jgi:hypothetical protein
MHFSPRGQGPRPGPLLLEVKARLAKFYRHRTTFVSTLSTMVPSGTNVTYPESTATSVSRTIAFGKSVNQVGSTSGAPSSYLPGATGFTGTLKGSHGGVSNKVILGVSIGLGVPVLLTLVAGCFL